MSELALLWFYNQDNEERIGRDIESPFIPRVGDTVDLEGGIWLVQRAVYLWPQPGSIGYNAGRRRPIVSIFVTETDGPFAVEGSQF